MSSFAFKHGGVTFLTDGTSYVDGRSDRRVDWRWDSEKKELQYRMPGEDWRKITMVGCHEAHEAYLAQKVLD